MTGLVCWSEASLWQSSLTLAWVRASWAAIILVPTLIAGIYGMNFEHMPELAWGLGYPFALSAMLVSALVLYRMFKHRDWL